MAGPVTCTSEHWSYEVSACDASSETRHITYAWRTEPKGCNYGALAPDTDLECGELYPFL